MGLSGWNLLPQTPEALNTAIGRAVRKAAFDIAARAIDGPPRDTGFMKGSIYVALHSGQNLYPYPDGLEPTHPGAALLEQVEAPPNDRTAYVAVGASYGIYVELGTANMAAQPYLLPAAEFVKPEYLTALRGLEGVLLSLLGGGGSIDTVIQE
jgi:hypothetical protein